ncbi:MAG: hypothetical protein AB7P69_28720 [Candidatus Binatia bacterium]
MKRLVGILAPVGMLLLSAYVLAATLASGEGEPVVVINNHVIPRLFVFVLGLVGVAGGVAVSLALLMDLSELPYPPKD